MQDVQAVEAAAPVPSVAESWRISEMIQNMPNIEDIVLETEDTSSTSELFGDNTTESDTEDSQIPEEDRILGNMLQHMNLVALANSSHRTVANFVRNVTNLLNQLSLRNLRTLFQDMQDALGADEDDKTTTSSDAQEDDTQSSEDSEYFETTTTTTSYI